MSYGMGVALIGFITLVAMALTWWFMGKKQRDTIIRVVIDGREIARTWANNMEKMKPVERRWGIAERSSEDFSRFIGQSHPPVSVRLRAELEGWNRIHERGEMLIERLKQLSAELEEKHEWGKWEMTTITTGLMQFSTVERRRCQKCGATEQRALGNKALPAQPCTGRATEAPEPTKTRRPSRSGKTQSRKTKKRR